MSERKRGEPSAPFLSEVTVPAKLPPDFATRGRKPLRSPYPSVSLDSLVSRFAAFCFHLSSCLHSYRKDVSYDDRDWISTEADNLHQTGLADELAIVFAARMSSFSLQHNGGNWLTFCDRRHSALTDFLAVSNFSSIARVSLSWPSCQANYLEPIPSTF